MKNNLFYEQIIWFWKKIVSTKTTFFGRFFFIFLVFGEWLYRAGFFLVVSVKKLFVCRNKFPFKVISVGNLSVGGSGKSVFVQFLVKKLSNYSSAIVMRGYRGKNEKTGKSLMVFDGSKVLHSASISGDEAFMMTNCVKVPIVVGKSRARSCNLLSNYCKNYKSKIDVVIFDDAYQNFGVNKDLDVLLLDAAYPFDNGHSLPAGRLREKDCTRADLIVLTRSDLISREQLKDSRAKVIHCCGAKKVFCGRHQFSGFSLFGKSSVAISEMTSKRFLVFAGIGSFGMFVEMLENLDIDVVYKKEYRDHYDYSEKDLLLIAGLVDKYDLDGAITTQKDWAKISPLMDKIFGGDKFYVYLANVEFNFIHYEEEKRFLKLVEGKLR